MLIDSNKCKGGNFPRFIRSAPGVKAGQNLQNEVHRRELQNSLISKPNAEQGDGVNENGWVKTRQNRNLFFYRRLISPYLILSLAKWTLGRPTSAYQIMEIWRWSICRGVFSLFQLVLSSSTFSTWLLIKPIPCGVSFLVEQSPKKSEEWMVG